MQNVVAGPLYSAAFLSFPSDAVYKLLLNCITFKRVTTFTLLPKLSFIHLFKYKNPTQNANYSRVTKAYNYASLKIARHNLCPTALSFDWLTQNMDRSENSRR